MLLLESMFLPLSNVHVVACTHAVASTHAVAVVPSGVHALALVHAAAGTHSGAGVSAVVGPAVAGVTYIMISLLLLVRSSHMRENPGNVKKNSVGGRKNISVLTAGFSILGNAIFR